MEERTIEKGLQECPHIMGASRQTSEKKEHPKAMEERT